MQLSTLPSIPSPQPASPYATPGQAGSSGQQSHDAGGEFAQLLPGPNQPSPQGGQLQKKPEKPTAAASEEAAAAYYSGWMSALYPQAAPILEASPQIPASSKAAEITSAGPRGAGQADPPVGRTGIPAANNAPTLPYFPARSSGAGEAAGVSPVPDAAPAAQYPTAADPLRMPLVARAAMPAAKPPVAALSAPQNLPLISPPPQSPLVNPAGAAVVSTTAVLGTSAQAISGAEKIAAQGPRTAGTAPSAFRGSDKKILSTDSKQVTNHGDSLGTTVAKVSPAMPTASQTERQPTSMLASASASGVLATANGAPSQSQAATSQMGVAQRAVEAALSSAEIFNSGGHKAVNLQFSVGNTDLSLTVQLRNGEIHTTFSTDSADLRSDLAHAWQSASPTSGGSLRLAEPVFTSPGAADGGSAFQQRGGQGHAESPQQTAGSAASNFSSPLTPGESSSPAQSPVALATSLHLQAFA